MKQLITLISIFAISVACNEYSFKTPMKENPVNEGFYNYLEGNYDSALFVFKELIALDSNDAYAYYGSGMANHGLGKFHEALSDMDIAIQLDTLLFNAYYIRGRIKGSLGLYREAKEDFNNAIKVNPDFTEAYLYSAIAENALGKHDQSIRGLIKVVKTYSQMIDENKNYKDYYNRGLAKYYIGDIRGAINDYDISIEINPRSAETYLQRGFANYYFKNFDDACSDWSKSLELGNYEAYIAIRDFCNSDPTSIEVLMESEVEIKKLYDRLKTDNWDVPDFKTFKRGVSNKENLYILRNDLINNGYSLPILEEFSHELDMPSAYKLPFSNKLHYKVDNRIPE